MGYSIYLNDVLMPVAPSKIEMKVKNQNSTLNLINGEEINIIRPPGLTEFSFELLIPQVKYPFAVYPNSMDGLVANLKAEDSERFFGAQHYLGLLERLKKDTKPFKFKIERSRPDSIELFETKVDMDVTLEEYSIIEDAANGFDLTIPVRLKQYRPYAGNSAEKGIQHRLTYTVKQGDTLWGICKRFLGDGSKYSLIADLNGIKTPNLIKVGQVIKLA